MLSARWRKLLGDARAERGRIALMVLAITVSLTAVGAVLGAWAVLTREIAVSYLGTRPATATLELPDGVDAAVVAAALADPRVARAEARDVVLARARVGDDWRPLLLFVIDDFAALRLNTFRRESGAWPPPRGALLLERSALGMAGAGEGERLLVRTPHGAPTEAPIAGVVHDPGLAPAWQEREIYAYATRETLALLGEAPVLHELRVGLRDEPRAVADAELVAESVARELTARGHRVHELRVPPPRQHPHQRQMMTILLLLLVFAGLSLVLSSVLVANALAAMLARQVREIGVMKALGARRTQLFGVYAALVGAIGLVAFVLAVPLGLVGARSFSTAVAGMLNFNLTDASVPPWVLAVVAGAGLLVPLLVAAVPIAQAARVSVRTALDDHGVQLAPRASFRARLPVALRDLLRRPARLALTVGLLATGGSLFMTALALSRAWERNLDKIYETRSYDVEVRFQGPASASVAERVRALPGVRDVEAWGYTPAAFARPGHVDVVRTYPDRGHGSLAVMAPPPTTTLIRFPLLAGRWLRAGDRDAVVLNHVAAAQAGGAAVGSEVLLSLEGPVTRWRVVGIVEEVGAAGIAYVTDAAFAEVAATGARARMLRVATSAGSSSARAAMVRRIEAELASSDVGVESVVPFSELRTAIGDHVAILIRALVALATILAVVGLLGLASAMGTSVFERTREIGVMKALGATSDRVRRLIVREALLTAALSWGVAVLLSLPLTWLVEGLIGRLGFLAPLPFTVSPWAMAAWLALLALATLGATLPPIRRANALTVREALATP